MNPGYLVFVVNCSFSTLLFIIEDIGMFDRHV
jgi:hypothetical protein